ncbi:AAA family ATPase [Rossellomorea sp. GCM10028870]|uniref:AAA family ATPase n=1 Tax=Rossellomorea sp. GCM10028870 TaxID=3273426 RepID=UPI0036126484
MEKYYKDSIKSFTIKGLFGNRTVHIDFMNDIKVVVGENGTGKTTLLNVIYYTLSCQFHKLQDLDFLSISINFTSGHCIELNKDKLNFGTEDDLVGNLREILNRDEFNYIIYKLSNNLEIEWDKFELLYRKNTRTRNNTRRVSYGLVRSKVKRLKRQGLWEIKLAQEIKNHLTGKILYFPTYRRIEQEIQNLGATNIEVFDEDNQLIQFGMKDVTNRFNLLTKNIKNSYVEWFSRLSGEMLSQFSKGIRITDDLRKKIKNIDTITIVLDRVGDNISHEDKQRIIELIRSEEIFQGYHDPLIYFLSKLVKINDSHYDIDTSINKFVEVCNKYLVHKEIVYDKKSVKISIREKGSAKPVDISKLSSGEKQIVSIFSRVYLNEDSGYIILFDEPELSLSIEWQKMLLPDIINSGKCNFMLAVTHSPFIFDNELDEHAFDLEDFYEHFEEEDVSLTEWEEFIRELDNQEYQEFVEYDEYDIMLELKDDEDES